MTDLLPLKSDPSASIIYVLTNEAMPGLVKIGRTSGDGVERRVAELSRATGVPLPFKVAVARSVYDAFVIEKALHVAFAPDRVNPAREFFAIEEHRAVAIVNAFPGTDLTPEAERASERAIEAEEPGSLAAAKTFERKRRPPMNFEEMGVPIGATITHSATGETAVVVQPKRILFRDEVISLTRAQQVVSGVSYAVQPGPHWTFNDRSIGELYEATYPFENEG